MDYPPRFFTKNQPYGWWFTIPGQNLSLTMDPRVKTLRQDSMTVISSVSVMTQVPHVILYKIVKY